MLEHFVLLNPTVMADLEAGRIEEANARARSKTGTQIGTQWQQGAREPINKATIADQTWKSTVPVRLYLLVVVGFEVAVGRLMEANQNRHDFAEAQAPVSLATS